MFNKKNLTNGTYTRITSYIQPVVTMYSLLHVLQGDIVLYENILHVKIVYNFTKQVNFKIS